MLIKFYKDNASRVLEHCKQGEMSVEQLPCVSATVVPIGKRESFSFS